MQKLYAIFSSTIIRKGTEEESTEKWGFMLKNC